MKRFMFGLKKKRNRSPNKNTQKPKSDVFFSNNVVIS